MSVSRFPKVFLCNFPRKATCKGKSKNITNKTKQRKGRKYQTGLEGFNQLMQKQIPE